MSNAWQIDASHSRIGFYARHMMISKVRGQFDKFSGQVQFDPNDPTSTTVSFEADVASINTRDEKRDGHLRSADFFDAENHSKLTFASKQVEVVDKDSAKLTGELTIRGVTRTVVLDVDFSGMGKNPWGQTVAGFTAKTIINRKDFGLEWNMALETGGLLVSEDVHIDVEVELVQ